MKRIGDRTLNIWIAGSLALTLVTTGCTSIQSLIPIPYTDATLTLNVEEQTSLGQYRITGKTSLPDETEISILAIRNLKISAPSATRTSESTYSVLAYTSVPVSNGQWNAVLDLWQATPDGRYYEAWQLEAIRLNVNLNSEDQILVLATLNPTEALTVLEQQISQGNQRLPRQAIRHSAEGDRYAQIYQQVQIPAPDITSTSLQPVAQIDDLGWGDRYLIPEEPPNPTQLEQPSHRITNAPTQVNEILQ